MTDDTATLDLHTMDALRGADDVRRRLLLEMSTGTPAISDLAYAVKVRVKEDFKVVEKVRRKRKGGKPEYSVAELRDLVGLRIVTLYRLDALEILPILLERIETSSHEPDSVFSRRGIEEIIIYSTNPAGDAQDLPGRVEALCQALGLSDRTETKQTPQNYTSIHIVVWCRGKYRGAYRDVPVEIQVRTAFEDVWGEIDHSLKYKREAESETETLDRAAASRLELTEAHLNVMKTLIDGLAQYSDQIKLQMEGDKRIRATSSRRSEQAVDRLPLITGLNPTALHLTQTVITAAQEAIDGATSTGRTPRRLRVAGDLIRAVKKVRDLKLPKNHENEILYVLEMERALLLFEIGNDLRGAGGNANLVEASRIYATMGDLFPDRVAPLYRIARTLDELGDKIAAIAKYQAAVDALCKSDLAADHWLRGAAPRLLGFAIWEKAIGPLRTTNDAAEREAALKQVLKAICLTKDGLNAVQHDELESVKSRNNLLYFILDYREHGGSSSELDKNGLADADISNLLVDLEASAADDISRWDTIRHAHVRLGDDGAALAAARKVLAILESPQRQERWSTNDGIVSRNALHTIETTAQPVGEEKQPTVKAT
jgi:ppGpp synthetase/RelA/SpoT-type nucleotidyltranferase